VQDREVPGPAPPRWDRAFCVPAPRPRPRAVRTRAAGVEGPGESPAARAVRPVRACSAGAAGGHRQVSAGVYSRAAKVPYVKKDEVAR